MIDSLWNRFQGSKMSWIGFAFFWGSLVCLPVINADAAEVQLKAQVDRNQISEDETINLKLTLKLEGTGSGANQPTYSAPDFELINEFNSSFVESYYRNGSFGVQRSETITHVLRPRNTGNLKISGIQAKVEGRIYRAPDVNVTVLPAGQGANPQQSQPGPPAIAQPRHGSGLRGAGKSTPGTRLFLRAEASKTRAYKGEEIIVSYYLYRRVRTSNLQVDKYPSLNGFLREDMEMPVLGQRLPTEIVTLEGVPYERSLLVRYAAYPLKEGTLTLDPMAVRAHHFGGSFQRDEEEEDPFSNFFRRMTPQISTAKSDPVKIEVLPLPAEGRPSGFSGAVGQFEMEVIANREELKTNEAMNVTIAIRGEGNLGAIEAPEVQWPESFEVYETRSHTEGGKGAPGKRTFEVLVVPRKAGEWTLPAVNWSSFNPKTQTYVNHQSEPITVNVIPGSSKESSPGNSAPSGFATGSSGSQNQKTGSARPLEAGPRSGFSLRVLQGSYWKLISGLLALALILLGGVRGLLFYRRQSAYSRTLRPLNPWVDLKKEASQAQDQHTLSRLYESGITTLLTCLDQRYAVDARTTSRMEWGQKLEQEHGFSTTQLSGLIALIEQAENVRYASSPAQSASLSAKKEELRRWLDRAENQASKI